LASRHELTHSSYFLSGQGNNAYIFPGIGLGVVAGGLRHVTDDMFRRAARALADIVTADDVAKGCLFPPISNIRYVSQVLFFPSAMRAWSLGWDLLLCCP